MNNWIELCLYLFYFSSTSKWIPCTGISFHLQVSYSAQHSVLYKVDGPVNICWLDWKNSVVWTFHWALRIAFLIFTRSITFSTTNYSCLAVCKHVNFAAMAVTSATHGWVLIDANFRSSWNINELSLLKILEGFFFFAIFKNMPRFLEWNPLISKGNFFWNMYYLEYQEKLIFKYSEPAYTKNSWFLC